MNLDKFLNTISSNDAILVWIIVGVFLVVGIIIFYVATNPLPDFLIREDCTTINNGSTYCYYRHSTNSSDIEVIKQ